MPYMSHICLAHFHFISIFISILQLSMQPMHQHNHEWYDPLHIITWPLWSIDIDLACSSPSPQSIDAKSCPSFTASRSIASKSWLALHHCNRSIKRSLVLIFSTLVTWLYGMFHMQWVPPSHYMSIASTLQPLAISLPWHMSLILVSLCGLISCVSQHKHLLVHLSCHSITKNKQGPFSLEP